MFKRYGVFVLALGLMVSALSGQAQEQDKNSHGTATEEQSHPQIFTLPLLVEIIESDATADARQRSEDEAKEREIRDLAAQQGMHLATEAMNDATQRMAQYALWSTLIVGFGTALLFWTLWETRKANRSTQAAVEVTREIGQAQLRAYLDISDNTLELNWKTGYAHVKLVFKNSGQTPAYKVKLYYDVYLSHPSDAGRISDMVSNRMHSYAVGPGSETFVRHPLAFPIDKRVLVRLRSHEQAVHIVGNLVYEDIFRAERFSKFHYAAYGILDGKISNYSFHPEGNESS
jgi:hypothetical protein